MEDKTVFGMVDRVLFGSYGRHWGFGYPGRGDACVAPTSSAPMAGTVLTRVVPKGLVIHRHSAVTLAKTMLPP